MRPRRVDPDDGRQRCRWATGDTLLAAYHDLEWGRPIRTDAGHLERLTLEVLQCGLSWRIVLVKRPALRRAFHGFRPARVAALGRRDVDRLCADAAIIRNRRKIEATIENARRMLALAEEHGSYRRWLDGHPGGTAGEQAALRRALQETFRFMGPETAWCYLMGIGKCAPAHDADCWRAAGRK